MTGIQDDEQHPQVEGQYTDPLNVTLFSEILKTEALAGCRIIPNAEELAQAQIEVAEQIAAISSVISQGDLKKGPWGVEMNPVPVVLRTANSDQLTIVRSIVLEQSPSPRQDGSIRVYWESVPPTPELGEEIDKQVPSETLIKGPKNGEIEDINYTDFIKPVGQATWEPASTDLFKQTEVVGQDGKKIEITYMDVRLPDGTITYLARDIRRSEAQPNEATALLVIMDASDGAPGLSLKSLYYLIKEWAPSSFELEVTGIKPGDTAVDNWIRHDQVDTHYQDLNIWLQERMAS